MKPEVVECGQMPACDPNSSTASSLHIGTDGFVAYDSQADVILLKCEGCIQIVAGPNDEAFHRHRFYALGLHHDAIQELTNSPWIQELSTTFDRDGLSDRLPGGRHFVLALKECSVDIAAKSIEAIGRYASHHDAMRAALTLAK